MADAKCGACHEKYADRLGVYGFPAHYLYRSGDFQRLVPSPQEVPCATCHTEHDGRESQLTRVEDGLCLRCHESHEFASGHPEFEAVANGLEDARLHFPHVHHVREVMRRQEIQDVERACLHCHQPEADGRGFEPLDCDRHCDACHLTTTTTTPLLSIASSATEIGVETLESIQASGELGTRWAYYTNPNELRATGAGIRKTPVYHRDPWILHNLRRLRQLRYPDAGLVDLLEASSQVSAQELPMLYHEAVATLRERALELRSSPDRKLQRELRQIESLLDQVERRLEDPYTLLDETEFLLALPHGGAKGDTQRAEIEALVGQLTEPCQQCHLVSNATIVRVQKEQSALRRAEFDHRAHILQRRCLDCHTKIPIAENLASTEPVAAIVDRAEIQDLPGIGTCRECHEPDRVSARCVTCHLFHPNKSQRSNLLLYLDR